MYCTCAAERETYTPYIERICIIYIIRLKWILDINAITAALLLDTALPSAPNNTQIAWCRAIADRIEQDIGDSREWDDEDKSK
jgi:hypothetical protein